MLELVATEEWDRIRADLEKKKKEVLTDYES